MITKKIDKEARTVVGTLANAKDDFKVFITNKIEKNSKYFRVKKEMLDTFNLANKYTSVARCHPDDEFDEEYGKELVKFKTLDKYYKDFDRKFKKVIIDAFCFAFNLLDFAYSKISIDYAENIVMEIAERTGYIISFYDEFEDDDEE